MSSNAGASDEVRRAVEAVVSFQFACRHLGPGVTVLAITALVSLGTPWNRVQAHASIEICGRQCLAARRLAQAMLAAVVGCESSSTVVGRLGVGQVYLNGWKRAGGAGTWLLFPRAKETSAAVLCARVQTGTDSEFTDLRSSTVTANASLHAESHAKERGAVVAFLGLHNALLQLDHGQAICARDQALSHSKGHSSSWLVAI